MKLISVLEIPSVTTYNTTRTKVHSIATLKIARQSSETSVILSPRLNNSNLLGFTVYYHSMIYRKAVV